MKLNYFFHSLFVFLISHSLLNSKEAFSVMESASWSDTDTYTSHYMNEPYLRVRTVKYTYEYDESGPYNYGHLITWADSSLCSSSPYSVIAKWTTNTTSSDESIRKFGGSCNTIAQFKYTCPGDSVIVGIQSDWNPYNCTLCDSQDRAFSFTCAFPKNKAQEPLRVYGCTEHPYRFKDVDSKSVQETYKNTASSSSSSSIDYTLETITSPGEDSSLTCPENKILRGLKSWYNLSKRSREFSASCCHLEDSSKNQYLINTENCEKSVTTEEGKDFDISCPASDEKSFINKIETTYKSNKDDRLFNLNCCSVEISPAPL